MSEELEQCPFCGCSVEMKDDVSYPSPIGQHDYDCPLEGEDIVATQESWNRRHTPPAAQVQGEREGFEAFIRNYCQIPDWVSVNWEARFNIEAWEIWQARAAFSAPPAAGVPEGWKLVPERMHLSPEDIAAIVFQCGGDEDAEQFEDRFNGGVLWVGETIDDDGSKSYGLNIACVECLEEGSTPVVEFSPPIMLATAPTQPASEQQQAVVLPERRVILEPSDKYCCKEIECEAWNDALDAVLRLNPHLAGVNQGVTTEAGNGGGE